MPFYAMPQPGAGQIITSPLGDQLSCLFSGKIRAGQPGQLYVAVCVRFRGCPVANKKISKPPAKKPTKKAAPKKAAGKPGKPKAAKKPAKKAARRKAPLPRPKISAEEKLYLLFREDYPARQIFDFLRAETVGDLEQHRAEAIIARLTAPIHDSVERIRRKLAEYNRYLAGDEGYVRKKLGK
jgi:hypothetical protein